MRAGMSLPGQRGGRDSRNGFGRDGRDLLRYVLVSLPSLLLLLTNRYATDWESIGEKQHHQSLFQEGNSNSADSETGRVTYGGQNTIHESSHPKEMTQEKVNEVV